jgi:parvulin-like peptidyl-prolyl isomerase
MRLDLTRSDPRRSLWLLAIGAATGLALAGYGLFTAKGTRSSAVPPEAIALVNQRAILRSDFVTQLQTQYSVPFSQSTRAQRERVLADMIAEELMVQRGLEVDLPSYDPDVRQALVAGVELQLFADVLAEHPSETQLEDYYDKHRDKYVRDGVMRLRDLVLVTSQGRPPSACLSAATEAVRALRRGGEPLDAVMARYEMQDSRRLLDSGHVDTGDVFDFAAKARLDPPVFEAARRLSDGQVSDPVVAPDGVHVVVMVKRVLPAQRAFADVANEVWRDLSDDARRRVRTANLEYLRSKADIQLADDARMP